MILKTHLSNIITAQPLENGFVYRSSDGNLYFQNKEDAEAIKIIGRDSESAVYEIGSKLICSKRLNNSSYDTLIFNIANQEIETVFNDYFPLHLKNQELIL